MGLSSFVRLLPFLATVSASLLLEGGTVISFDESSQELKILRNASVLVENGQISRLSEEPITVNLTSNVERIDATDKIISPGFINSHQHSWQTAFKTIASNTSLADYFQKYGEFSPANEHFTPDDIYLGQLTASLELLNEGTTTILEHAHGDFSDEGAHKAANASYESGLRTYFAMAIHELPNYDVEDQLAVLEDLAQDSRFTSPDSVMKIGLAYDAFANPDNEELINRMWNITTSNNLSVVTTHYLGGAWSNANDAVAVHQYGWLNTSIPVVFSHASFIDPQNADLLRQTNQYISTTPESELHYGHGHPHAYLIQDQASLGVDTHFTYSTSMVWQARLWLQTLRAKNYNRVLDNWEIPVNNPIEGAKADLVVFDTTSPALLGWDDPVAAIILHSSPADIEHVIINGEFVKKNGKLTFENYQDLRQRFTQSARKIQKLWREMEWPALEGKFSGLSDYAQAPEIDTKRGDGTGYEG